MFGLDEYLAHLGAGEAFALVALVSVLLGLRHATDPDHVAAVATLVAGDAHEARRAGRLGVAWGAGHGTSLFAFGVPIVLSRAFLPEAVQTAAEAAVGVLIIALSLRLLRRRHTGHARARTGLQAYGIGVVHGMGGSAGVGVLLLAGIPDHAEALVALGLFSLFTAVSMALASTTIGYALARGAGAARRLPVAPAMGAVSLAFGCWYFLGALDAVPYVL